MKLPSDLEEMTTAPKEVTMVLEVVQEVGMEKLQTINLSTIKVTTNLPHWNSSQILEATKKNHKKEKFCIGSVRKSTLQMK